MGRVREISIRSRDGAGARAFALLFRDVFFSLSLSISVRSRLDADSVKDKRQKGVASIPQIFSEPTQISGVGLRISIIFALCEVWRGVSE